MAEDVCPWWLGYLLANPIRRFFENPEKLLSPHIKPGMTVLDFGCAMGFFTIPAARLTGPTGRVIAVDLQPKMITALQRRSERRGLQDRVETHVCGENDLGLPGFDGRIDLALAIHVMHEVPDSDRLFAQIFKALKPGGRLLLKEPKGHVSVDEFRETVAEAGRAGFIGSLDGAGQSRFCLLSRP
jgi:ubiquinone/menaquinone biosynthesis C-methylase UbiE